MAYPGKVIANPKTGQQISFVKTAKETNGSMLEMECLFQPHSTVPPLHYHPWQEEIFIITQGSLNVNKNGVVQRFSAGDSFSLPPNTPHSMWNDSNGITVVNWKVLPALDTEYFLETAMGIATNRKTNQQGMPGLLQVSLTADRFSGIFRLAKPAFTVQRILFWILRPLSCIAGYKAVYPEYID